MANISKAIDKTIEIVPDTLLMRHLGSSGHTLIKALSELVDNALDSFLEHREELKKLKQNKVHVSIQIERYQGIDRIVVQDDAYGMSDQELHDALTLARTVKPVSKTKELIGRFGMGMKTACSSLGKEFEFKTGRPGEIQTHIVVYNEDKFVRQKTWNIKLISEPKERLTHGTHITLWSLKKKPQNKSYLKDHFSRIFSYYITNGILELLVQDEIVQPYVPELLTVKNASGLKTFPTTRERWSDEEVLDLVRRLERIKFDEHGKKHFDFTICDKLVAGWVGLLKHGSQKGQYGFNLIRHDRVIREHEKIGFGPHPALARIVGELHLDDWDVNYNKDDFIRDTEEWHQLSDEKEGLSEYISDVGAISRRMADRQRGLPEIAHAEAERQGRKFTEPLRQDEFFEHLSEEVIEESLKHIGPSSSPLVIKPITAGEAREVQSKARASIESVSSVHHELEHPGSRAPYVAWETSREGKKKVLVVRTNADHPFFRSLPDGSRRWYYAFLIAESYAEYVQKEIGYESFALVKNAILAAHGPQFLSATKAGKDEFSTKLVEKI